MSAYILRKWQRPRDWSGQEWNGYYVFLCRDRDSGELDNSNFETAHNALHELPAYTALDSNREFYLSRYIVRESHWLCGWIEWIAIHGGDTLALQAAEEMADRMERYAVLDENDYTARELEHAARWWYRAGLRERIRAIGDYSNGEESIFAARRDELPASIWRVD